MYTLVTLLSFIFYEGVNYCIMRAVHAESGINDRRHITAVNPLEPVIVVAHAHKLINDVFIYYDFQYPQKGY